MQKLKSKVYEKFQIEHKVQTVKGLLINPIFQLGVAVLIAVGFLSWLRIKPLGLTFLVILCFWLYKHRCSIRIQTTPELYKHFELVQQRVIEFRQTNPAMFCAVASSCLGALAVVGHLVSSSMVVLTGLIFAAIISTKYNLKIMKIEPKDLDFAWSEKLQQDYELDDEFMPEENETNLFVLERAGELASLTLPTEDAENEEDNSDEIPSELLIPDSIPELCECSTDDDEDDLLPIVSASKSETHIEDSTKPTTDVLVKYSQSDDTIEFKKSHFKYGSSLSSTSSSSEESLSQGLQFPDHTAVDGTSKSESIAPSNTLAKPITSSQQETNDLVAMTVTSQTQALLANSSKLIPTLVSGLVQGVLGMGSGALPTHSGPIHDPTHRRLVTALDSSDESDFEIIEEEDYQ